MVANRYTRVHRLLRILALMQSGAGWNAQRLAQACNTTKRNIFRDLNMLEGAGVPYYWDAETDGYRVRGDFFMPPVELTLEESLALQVLAESIGGTRQIPFLDPAARAIEKIRGQLPKALLDQLGELDQHVEVKLAQSSDGDAAIDVYQLVRAAIASKRMLRCSYESLPTRNARRTHRPMLSCSGATSVIGSHADSNLLNVPWMK